MPNHWKIDKETKFPKLKAALVFVGAGGTTMEELWARSHPECPSYEAERDQLRERIAHINVVAALLLTMIATFCTTDPPVNSTIFPYTRKDAYLLFLSSLGFSFGGLIVGSAAVFVIAKASAEWFCDKMMRTRGRIWATMFILSYPFISIGLATLCFASALLITASRSDAAFLRCASYFMLIGPLSCAFLFVWIVRDERGSRSPESPSIPRDGDGSCRAV